MKLTVTLHDADGAMLPSQLFVCANGLGMVTLEMLMLDALVFVTVMTPDPETPSTSEYNARGVGETVKFETISPFPLRLTVCAPPGPNPAAFKVPLVISFVRGNSLPICGSLHMGPRVMCRYFAARTLLRWTLP